MFICQAIEEKGEKLSVRWKTFNLKLIKLLILLHDEIVNEKIQLLFMNSCETWQIIIFELDEECLKKAAWKSIGG